MDLSVSPSRPCVGLGSDLITDVFAEDYTGKKTFREVSRSSFFSSLRDVLVFGLLVYVLMFYFFKECFVLSVDKLFSYCLSRYCVI